MFKWMNTTGRQPGPAFRIKALYLFLAAANLMVWAWTWLAFRSESALLGTAALAYGFGLRHALDADHIAAIDNVTRKLMHAGAHPVMVGFFFALGHSLVVIIASVAIGYTAKTFVPYLPQIQQYGGIVSATISTLFLTAIGLINLLMLAELFRAFQRMRRGEQSIPAHAHDTHAHGGMLARLCRPLFGLIDSSWQMVPLGFLFGLGFETATEIALLSTTVIQAAQGVGMARVLLFPAFFTVGMLTVDATDGVLMLRVYGWAFVKPLRKLYYNLVLTMASTLVAFVIAGIGAAGLVQEHFQMAGGLWRLIMQAHENHTATGCIIIGVIGLIWLGSHIFYRIRKYGSIGTGRSAAAAAAGMDH